MKLENEKIKSCILDSIPYPIVFSDTDHVIQYMNSAAKYHYYTERGYRDLIGKSLFACHGEQSKEKIVAAFEKIKNHGNELFLGVTVKNQRIYLNPVRDENGDLIGYFDAFELNVEK